MTRAAILGAALAAVAAAPPAAARSGAPAKRPAAAVAPAAPTVVAACRGGTVMVEAEWLPAGGLRPLHREFSRETPRSPFPPDGAKLRKQLKTLAKTLPRMAWYRPGAGPVPGASFPSPALQDEEQDGCVERTTDLRLALGPCPGAEGGGDEWLLTTAPLAPLALERAQADARIRAAVAKLGAGKLDRLDVRRVPGAPALLDVRFSGVASAPGAVRDPESGAERPVPMRVEGWALFGAGPEPLASKVLVAHDPEAALPASFSPASADVGDAEWSALAASPGVRVAVIRFASGSGGVDGDSSSEAGFWIVRVEPDGRVHVEALKTEDSRPC